LIIVDAEKMLLCQKTEKKNLSEWKYQFNNAPLFLDRYEALENISKGDDDSLKTKIILKAMDDKFWGIREFGINYSKKINSKEPVVKSYYKRAGDPDPVFFKNIHSKDTISVRKKLIQLAETDDKSSNRANAIKILSSNYKDTSLVILYEKMLNDSSYFVISEALNALSNADDKRAMKIAKQFENETNESILSTIASIYAKSGMDENNNFFLKTNKKMSGVSKYSFINSYSFFLISRNDSIINLGLPILENAAKNETVWWIRLSAVQAMNRLIEMYKDPTTEQAKIQKEKVETIIKNIKEKETDKYLLRLMEGK